MVCAIFFFTTNLNHPGFSQNMLSYPNYTKISQFTVCIEAHVINILPEF